jgi:hypothetical protein
MILLEQLTSTQYAWAQLLSTVGAGIILFGLIGISILCLRRTIVFTGGCTTEK